MKDLIEMVAKRIVNHPEDVQLRVIESEDGEQYELQVNEEDMGRIIGREGKTAKALRTILSAAAAKQEKRASLSIIE